MHRIKSKLTALALCFGVLLTLPVTANAAAPSDVSDHWAEKYLTEYVEKGCLKGKGDGLIHPDDTMTRAEFAALNGFSDGAQVAGYAKNAAAALVEAAELLDELPGFISAVSA